MSQPLDWRVTASDGNARAGTLTTRRSTIRTPVFMPVGTQGAIKGIRFEWLENEINAQIILGNTYHLFLRPGLERMRRLGGLHRFTTWARSFLTDSGGFQVFSLSDLRKISEEGVEFRSHIDGSRRFLSPEVSMEMQAALGSEIVMVFDECLPGETDRSKTRESLDRTVRWAQRSKGKFDELQRAGEDTGFCESAGLSGHQALFGIIQGAAHRDLRMESLERTVAVGFDGYAIGGLSVGEEKAVMYEVLSYTAPAMPESKPRYLMGVGTPEDIVEAIGHGVDMFDCVIPTRNGRTGTAFTSSGKINIRNARFAEDRGPLDPECGCSVCKRYSTAYLRHLYQAGEMGAATLISHHNLAFFSEVVTQARSAIESGTFGSFRHSFLDKLAGLERPTV